MSANWTFKKLRDVAEVRVSNVDKKTVAAEKPVRLCNYMDVYTNEYITSEIQFMAASASSGEIQRFGLIRGDVIITKDSETPDDIGVPAVVVDDIRDLVCGYHLALFRPDMAQVNPIYLAKQLGTDRISKFFGRFASGSTRYGLPTSVIESAEIPVPPLAEQTRIAEVLSTVDRAIKNTEGLISKQQRIKAGLMQDLLQRGVDERGDIRSETIHQFRDTPLGILPVEWDVKPVNKVGSVTIGRQLSPKQRQGKNPTPYLRVANVFDGWIDYTDILEMDFTPQEREKFFLVAGDVLLNEGQSLELVGRSAIYDGPDHVYCFQNTLIRFRANRDVLPTYARAVFKWWLDTGVFQQVARQTTSVAHLGADRFAQMLFPLPNPAEQERIVSVLVAHEAQMHALESQSAKLRALKTALMQDLLTGRKPVTPLLTLTEETPDDRGQNPEEPQA